MEEEKLKRIIKEALEETGNPWKIAFFSFLFLFVFVFIIIGMSQPYL
jgi:hypothetical protein